MTEKPMAQKHIYPGINCFKLLAALFVIMIHTSPLTSVSPEADFVLTRIIARTAVLLRAAQSPRRYPPGPALPETYRAYLSGVDAPVSARQPVRRSFQWRGLGRAPENDPDRRNLLPSLVSAGPAAGLRPCMGRTEISATESRSVYLCCSVSGRASRHSCIIL